jgi:predicted flavoprotein YhiN
VFNENLLFTHRGMSGPAILQISSYWKEGAAATFDLLPELDAPAMARTGTRVKSEISHSPRAEMAETLRRSVEHSATRQPRRCRTSKPLNSTETRGC